MVQRNARDPGRAAMFLAPARDFRSAKVRDFRPSASADGQELPAVRLPARPAHRDVVV
ncbi:MAG TPA: hypothetical protein VK525_04295 [Candidatus Saccharimonadales bacterium]|nr:hypothetical protein [Candidatus Saccharimonadales bacterium]